MGGTSSFSSLQSLLLIKRDRASPFFLRSGTRLHARPRPHHRCVYLVWCGAADEIARGDRAFEREHGEDVVIDRAREMPQFVEAHRGQILLLLHAVTNGLAHYLVSVAEGDALAHEVFGKVGGGGGTLHGRAAHVVALGLDGRHHVGIGAHAGTRGGGRGGRRRRGGRRGRI